MKIVHLCISQSYFDNWGYQENLIPEYQADLGNKVSVISTNKFYPNWLNNDELDTILSKGKEYNIGKVKIIRIKVLRLFHTHIVFTYNLYKKLKDESPDIIFYHEMTNFSTIICVVYKLFHPKISFFIDSHSDLRNSCSTKISELLYFKFFLTIMHKIIAIFVEKYYGVTPSRCNFLLSHYGISKKKMKFLPIGCDTKLANKLPTIDNLRRKYNIPFDSFVIVSGGKMGKFKGTEFLIKAVENLRKKDSNILLILFGVFEDQECEDLTNSRKWIIKHAWCERKKTLELLKVANIASWPVHHTTLNEDSIAVGTPLLIRKTTTTEHLISQNGLFLNEIGNVSEIEEKLLKIKQNLNFYKKGAELMAEKLSYSQISKNIIKDAQ